MTLRGRIAKALVPATVETATNVCRTGGSARREVLDRVRKELGLPAAKNPPRRGRPTERGEA